MESVIALALTTDAFEITSAMTLSILLLRPVYFLAANTVTYLDAGLDSALGVVLIIIGAKLVLAQAAGIELPLWAVVSALTAWRWRWTQHRRRRLRTNRRRIRGRWRDTASSHQLLQSHLKPPRKARYSLTTIGSANRRP